MASQALALDRSGQGSFRNGLSSSSTSATRPVHNATLVRSAQPLPSTLALYGIKVRDFAYESTLPPIAPIPRVPRQIQPDPRPLKRARDENDENGLRQSESTVSVEGRSRKSRSLERKLTEPAAEEVDQPDHPLATRPRGFLNLTLYERGPSQPVTPTSPSRTTEGHGNDSSPMSQPPLQFDSQESEPYIETPLVTPRGTLQWQQPIVERIILPSQLDNDGQRSGSILVSYSFTLPGPKADDRLSPALTSPSKAPSPPSDLEAPIITSPAFARYFFRTRTVATPHTPPRRGRTKKKVSPRAGKRTRK